jgi:hypothetical protein
VYLIGLVQENTRLLPELKRSKSRVQNLPLQAVRFVFRRQNTLAHELYDRPSEGFLFLVHVGAFQNVGQGSKVREHENRSLREDSS